MKKIENDLRHPMSIVQMQLDAAKEIESSLFWKNLNELLRLITPNVKVNNDENK